MNDTDVFTLSQQGMVANFYLTKLGRLPTKYEAMMYLIEEMSELVVAIEQGALDEEILKEIQDVRYTLAGYELARGWNGDSAFQLVHNSNMTKQPATNGKVQKGEGYVAPDLRECLGGNA